MTSYGKHIFENPHFFVVSSIKDLPPESLPVPNTSLISPPEKKKKGEKHADKPTNGGCCCMDHVSALSAKPLSETKSGPPDMQREAAWLKRKKEFRRWQRRRCKSFTDSDLDELRACIELGFGFEFDSADLDPKLSSAFPALDFYCAVNKQFHSRSDSLSRSSSSVTVASSDSDTSRSSAGSSSSSLFEPGDDPEVKKTRLRQWVQVVACTVRQCSPR